MSATPTRVAHGLNESMFEKFVDNETGPIADNVNWTITFPVEYLGKTAIPVVRAVITYGAGAAGARTATYYPIIDTGSALIGVEVVSFVETTGVLTLTNRFGSALSNIRTLIEVWGDVQ